MAQASTFGQRVRQQLHLTDTPPSLITRSLRGIELAATETRNDNPVPGRSGSAADEAYFVSLKLQDYPDCELWDHGKCVMKTDVKAGTTYLYDLRSDPGYIIDKPFHSLHFYLPRSALDGIARESRVPRGDLACQFGFGHDDQVMRHIGAVLLEALSRPAEANQLFIDHMMLAFTAHIAQAYGGLQSTAGPARGGLAPWQVKRACERLDSDLGGRLSLQLIAAEFGLSVSHFSRAFRISTGLPPHQWLLRQRVNAAKQLMTARDLSLSEIAISAGFANQSHFTKVFSVQVGISPAAWRREAAGGSEDDM
ncbi:MULTISPECIES: helix-turn-helix domain-containing protein [Bradyrhizobium]|jgi:AraC family transcriptional regulator|uniref:AraC family transcriptional regulator n=2 Tax=Bradyrhizobium ottawaense TaxID=931866 RepID=A0A2U8PGL0_9BRAD|nr:MULTISPECIES: AraC family transcriptional regulator [Bradyrhizobium]AWL96891.1 AraC family transcriptional regulator [Bradyrhizobium ottawaense]MBR1289971.1 helix-turn-helix transcriptional regulator [Bradyrhizobium ottawaense]MBR1325966.1 helix-turn-helix transcriptional regulator [Bradyrhizobium ottawaense]MBR1366096.1 helix-turn-helix transcriptional regulator [Bradyrhizobium ottawaense]MDA9419804.1 AraC family transcriptional regulator [Bradyrhizobium sp. CCBAU 25360]